jgi:hypothetical protein
MKIYGSEQERRELAAIRARYPHRDGHEIINPATDLPDFRGQIEPYLAIVRSCSVVVYSEYQFFVGKGVLMEICEAAFREIHTYRLSLLHPDPQRPKQPAALFQPFGGFSLYDCTDWGYRYAKTKTVQSDGLFTLTQTEIDAAKSPGEFFGEQCRKVDQPNSEKTDVENQ